MNKVGIYYAYWTHDWDADLASSDIAVRRAGINHLNRIGDPMVKCGIDRLSGIIYSN
ncbi:MAG: hypothetical protein GH155_01595 [Spirochaeta sp.]|nr:hypothetical protein [Spirochaeta sp.]